MPTTPHVVRFTRALALLSGVVLPIAALHCGGGVDTVGDGTPDGDVYDGYVTGTDSAPYEPDAEVFDGFVSGVRPIDAAPDANPYDGRVTGVDSSFDAADASDAAPDVLIGGPLDPPEIAELPELLA